jgi:hypothetical protein
VAIRKCPICGSDVIGDTCFTCGFELKNEEDIAVGHIPEPRQSEGYKAAQPSNSGVYTGNESVYSGAQTGYSSAPSAAGGGFTQAPGAGIKYADDYNNIPRVQVVNPNDRGNYAPPKSDFDIFCEHVANMTFSEKFTKYWWVMLISLILPAAITIIPAIALMLFKNPSVRKVGQNLLILGIIGMFVFG